jgi:hypothetical protein
MTTPTERHLTALELDQLGLGALDAGARESVGKHLAVCAECTARQAEHAEWVRHFQTTVFGRTVGTLGVRGARTRRRWWLLAAMAVPAMAGAVLIARGAIPPGRSSAGVAEPTIGIKGGPALHVFVRRSSRGPGQISTVTHLADGSRLSPGDALRFMFDPVDMPYAMIASVDGAGQTNIYFPFRGERSQPIDGRQRVAVPGSIVLDHAPGPERLFVIYSAQPLEARIVRAALARSAAGGGSAIRAARRLELPDTVQATFIFEKDVSP